MSRIVPNMVSFPKICTFRKVAKSNTSLSAWFCTRMNMDFLNGRLKPIYLKYLCAAFGSAMITSVYSIVDMAIVGKYQGAEGTAVLHNCPTDTILTLYQLHKCLLSALFSVKDSFYCNACFCTGAITCHIIHNLNPFLISVIALTLYKDMDLLALPYPQVSEKWRKKTGKQI